MKITSLKLNYTLTDVFMIIKKLRLILFLTILLMMTESCKKKKENEVVEPGIIENKTFNNTVLIDGHDFDNTIIRNCIFEEIDGDALQIRDVDNLCVEKCIFRNISEDAIRFRNSGSSNGVKILGCEIYNVEENGILAPENHINTTIKNNLIYNTATNNTSSQFGAPHHGIYFQGFNVSVTENTIYNIKNDQGNCISIRTYGTIARNTLYNATDHGISYFSDHPGNNGTLLIENNMIFDNGARGINLASNGNNDNHIGSAKIRFNTIISATKSPIGMGNDLTDVDVQLIANILIRTDGESTFVFSGFPYYEIANLKSETDINFVNFAARDLHIKNTSPARGMASILSEFPNLDFDGDSRSIDDLDVGADEI